MGHPDTFQALRDLNCDILTVQEGHAVEMMKGIAHRLCLNLIAFAPATSFPGCIFTRYEVKEGRIFNHAGPTNQNAPFSRFVAAALLTVEGKDACAVNFHAWPHHEAM
ncbi:MAG: hypothetical protein GX161_15235 [Firmicutes bacterium]|nr:hypothetical protein [Bacillota bacterium]